MFKQYYLKKSGNKVVLISIATILFVYILLFEFILPVNKILPKPSILYLSVTSLFTEYNFLHSFLFTISVIYISMFLSYFAVKLFSNILMEFSYAFPNLDKMFIAAKYILPVFLIIIFKFWFGNNSYPEYFFALIISGTLLKETVIRKAKKTKKEYINSALSLGLSQKEVYKKIVWKCIQPDLFKVLLKTHFFLWSWIIVYEFIDRTKGLGNILRLALKYNDISIFVLLVLIIIFTMFLFTLLFGTIKRKFFFWEI